MKKIIFALAFIIASVFSFGQTLVVHNSGNAMYAKSISEVDSITFNSSYSKFSTDGNTATLNIQKALIDSLTFSGTSVTADKIYIIYNGNDDATIINPYASQGVNITASAGTVNVTAASGISNLEYNLLGSASEGSLTMSSDAPATFVLNNLNLTNPSGPAILITGNYTYTFNLSDGTTNSISDGSSSSKNGTLQSAGPLVFTGTGTLNAAGVKKHTIYSSKSVEIQNGNLNITSAASDGIHSEGFTMSNGSLNVSATGDAVDAGDTAVNISGGTIIANLSSADVKAVKTGDADILISGGTFNLTLSGAQSKAISAKGNITIDNGSVTATLSGPVVLEESGSGYDPSYSTAIKSDADITINNGTFNLTLTSGATGGKGISADGNITINGGNITISTAGNGAVYTNENGTTDSYSAHCIKSDVDTKIYAGTLNLTSTGTAGKAISADGQLILGNVGADNSLLNLTAKTTGTRFLVTGSGQNADYANPKVIKAEGNLTVNSGTFSITGTQTTDGGEGMESKAILTINGGKTEISTWDDSINASSAVVINGGETYCTAKGNDGIDSNGTLTINGGFTVSNGARNPEEGFDCDQNTFKITGGIIVGTGGNTSNPSSVSTQKSIKISTTAGTSIYLKNSAGTTILMYKVPAYTGSGSGNSVTLLFTDPAIVNGSYTLYRGGTISGGTENHGYYTGAPIPAEPPKHLL